MPLRAGSSGMSFTGKTPPAFTVRKLSEGRFKRYFFPSSLLTHIRADFITGPKPLSSVFDIVQNIKRERPSGAAPVSVETMFGIDHFIPVLKLSRKEPAGIPAELHKVTSSPKTPVEITLYETPTKGMSHLITTVFLPVIFAVTL